MAKASYVASRVQTREDPAYTLARQAGTHSDLWRACQPFRYRMQYPLAIGEFALGWPVVAVVSRSPMT
jgi:hypothetical protein